MSTEVLSRPLTVTADKALRPAVYRHEDKYLINRAEAELLKRRLQVFLHRDKNAPDGGYFIRSLYFDDAKLSAYNDKLSGYNERAKYRIRFYNMDESYIVLEKKEKRAGMTHKTSGVITKECCERLIARDGKGAEKICPVPIVKELSALISASGMRPAVLVDYDRVPFTFAVSNVRVTLDIAVRTCPFNTQDIFSHCLPCVPALPDGTAVLEVKYNSFLPMNVSAILEGVPKAHMAISKYVLCLNVVN